jgi:CTP:molybdopterin cytidylyltransferase MocA
LADYPSIASVNDDEVSDFPFGRCGLRPVKNPMIAGGLRYSVAAGLSRLPEHRERQFMMGSLKPCEVSEEYKF